MGELAGKIAEIETGNEELTAASYHAGWLSGVGRLVFAAIYTEEYQSLMDGSCSRTSSLVSAEEDCFGCHHLRVGGFLLGVWGVPMSIVEALIHCLDDASDDKTFSPTIALRGAILLASESPRSDTDNLVFDRRTLRRIESTLGRRLARWKQNSRLFV